MSDNFTSTVRSFANNTFLFLTVVNRYFSTRAALKFEKQLLIGLTDGIKFNPDVNKPAQGEIFSRKLEKEVDPQIVFNNLPVIMSNVQKHLWVYLGTTLDFTHKKPQNKLIL